MKLYNTLSRQIELLKPLEDKKIKMYTCGLTVYNQPHIGNWVGYIYWDLMVRLLKYEGFDVSRVQNITDVGHLTSDDDAGEDKMEKGAKSEGVTAWDIAEKYSNIAYEEAYEELLLLEPDKLVKATDYIPQQIEFVEQLSAGGYTYIIENEGVYFDTSKIADYGKLARLDISGLQAGARVPIKGKRNITDFALWKFSPKDKNRDMEWESPWGKGFPGWHLECSTIAFEELGERIDIHTGGVDHIPVHHTNEIAQTEALTHKPFSQIWVHNNHLKVDGSKMSKSLGNIYSLKDIKDKGFDVLAFKLMILSKHYRSEGNFTWENLEASQNRLNSLRNFVLLRWQVTDDSGAVTSNEISASKQQMLDAFNNDLGTSEALAVLSELENEASNRGVSNKATVEFNDFITWLDGIYSLDLSSEKDITSQQRELINKRHSARQAKDWKASDMLRDELKLQGLAIRDTHFGQVWERY